MSERPRRNNTLTITDIKTTLVDAPWGPWRRLWPLVKIETAEGLSGYGDAFVGTPHVTTLVEGFKDLLVGEAPTNVEALFRKMMARAYAGTSATHFDGGLAVHAVSGLETALWDLARDSRRLYRGTGGPRPGRRTGRGRGPQVRIGGANVF